MGRTREMTSRHVRAFVDGNFLLRHLADAFRGLAVGVLCRRCGQEPRAHRRGVPTIDVTCGCEGHGVVRIDRPLDTAPLLLALGWTLTCPDCQTEVEGANSPQDPTFTVTCPCTTRTYVAGRVH